MVTRREREVVNTLKAKGCVEFPFPITFCPGRIFENTEEGDWVKKLAADNGMKLCSEPKALLMTLMDACDLNVADAVIKLSDLGAYILDSGDKCISGHLVCVVSDDSLVGACKESDSIKGFGSSCSC